MKNSSSKRSRKVTQEDVEKAFEDYVKRGGSITRLPEEPALPRRYLGGEHQVFEPVIETHFNGKV